MTGPEAPILVFGADGQVGRALVLAAAARGRPLVALPRSDADVTDAAAVRRAVEGIGPALVVNAAAHTRVDAAEAEADLAFAVNRDGAARVAEACARRGVPLVHLSTDYVFDGEAAEPYREEDPARPLNVYGAGKLAGEEAVRAAGGPHLILRTARVFGPHGRSFVRSILDLAATRPEISVVNDQIGCPTPAAAIAGALLDLAPRLTESERVPRGIYHYAGAPACSWWEFARAILAAAGRPEVAVLPVPSSAYPTPARRPRNAALACGKAARLLGLAPPDWRAALPATVAALRGGPPGRTPP